MVENDVVIFLLAVVGTVCVLIIFYYILICISSSRINKTITTVQRARATRRERQLGGGDRPQGQEARRTVMARSIQSSRLPHADENAYILGPTSTAAESQRDFRSGRPHRGRSRMSAPGNFGMSTDTSLMRFYTAEELVNFPFDEHIEALRRQIEEEEETRRRNLASMNACMHPIDYNGRRATVAAPSLIRQDREPGLTVELSPDHSYAPPIMIRNVINTEDRISVDGIQTRQSRARMCYSIPASYIGRPPAYLACDEEDPPPEYNEIVKLTQIKEEEVTQPSTSGM